MSDNNCELNLYLHQNYVLHVVGKKKKCVYQMKNGILVKTYPTISSAAKFFKTRNENIIYACKQGHLVGGFQLLLEFTPDNRWITGEKIIYTDFI
jgi:hypothetical protein